MDKLLAAYGLTSCDTVAKYCGIGKITMWKAMQNNTFDIKDVYNINTSSENDLK